MNHRVILASLVLGSSAGLAYPQAPDQETPLDSPREAALRAQSAARDVAQQVLDATQQFAQVRQAIELARGEAAERPERPEQPELPELPEPPEPPEGSADAMIWAGPRSSGPLLVVRTDATTAEVQEQLEEDMAVMLRILDKAIERRLGREEGGLKAMGIPVLGGGAGNVRALFLEAHGPLFLLSVRFPLLPAAEAVSDAKPKTETETEWEHARRELSGGETGWAAQVGDALRVHFGPDANRPYDARRVEQLRSGLLESLKNATHIRNLKADETVTLSVFGTEAGAAAGGGRGEWTTSRARSKEGRLLVVEDARRKGRGAKGTVMTIRARKSDIDAYASGRLDDAEFARKAKVTVYAGTSPAGAGFFGLGF